jgi:hypothetical protein
MIRFLQVFGLYTDQINSAMKRHPGIADLSHYQQMALLLEDGGGAMHAVAPHLPASEYETLLVAANMESAQRAWLREHGLPITMPLNEIVWHQAEHFRPDVIYLTDPVNFDSKFIRCLTHRPRLVFAWRAASILPSTDWREVDVFVSNHEESKAMAPTRGARHVEHHAPGFPESLAAALADVSEEYDVSFAGQWTSEHSRRNGYWTALANADIACDLHWFLMPASGMKLPDNIAAKNNSPRFGMDLLRLFKQSRINLNAAIDISRQPSANMRFLEISGAGGFQLIEHGDDVAQLLEPGKEVETFRSPGEMVEKIKHYLAHPEERQAIAKAGQARILAEHSVQLRANHFKSLIQRYYPQTSPNPVWIPQELNTWLPAEAEKAQIAQLKEKNATLKQKLSARELKLAELDASLVHRLTKPLQRVEQKLRQRFSSKAPTQR